MNMLSFACERFRNGCNCLTFATLYAGELVVPLLFLILPAGFPRRTCFSFVDCGRSLFTLFSNHDDFLFFIFFFLINFSAPAARHAIRSILSSPLELVFKT